MLTTQPNIHHNLTDVLRVDSRQGGFMVTEGKTCTANHIVLLFFERSHMVVIIISDRSCVPISQEWMTTVM